VKIGNSKVKIYQTLAAFTFVFFSIAAGHLFMVIINHVDEKVSRDLYTQPVVQARWFGDQPIDEELIYLQKEAENQNNPQEAAVYQKALEEFKEKGSVTFYMLPVSRFLLAIIGAMILAALILLVLSKHAKSDVTQTVIGIFAGLLLWTGGVEYGLMTASRALGLAKSLKIFQGNLIGGYGEYILLKFSWGFLLVVIFYILFQESVRCNFALFFRRNLHLMKGPIASGRIDNYAPRTAFLYATVMWFFYVLLLLAYDGRIFGVYSWFTYTIFFLSFAFTGYLVLRLATQPSMGKALRYSIPATMVLWNDVEIMAKWHYFKEPWLILKPLNAAIFFGGLILGTILVVRWIRRSQSKSVEVY
jgi:hypothetical protein